MSTLVISLFGTVQVSHVDPALLPGKLTRTIQALLAYLLIERRRLHPRDVLSGLLWGEYETLRARNCLNTALWRLRQVLEPEGVQGGTFLMTNSQGDVGFNCDSSHWLDIEVFQNKISRVEHLQPSQVGPVDIAELESALQLYTGDLLEGFYEEWALREREHLRRQFLNALAFLMHAHHFRQEYENGTLYGQKLLRCDPLREEVHRELMRMYAESGQRSLALKQYEICRAALHDELGITTMEETRLLYQQLSEAGDAPLPPAPALRARAATAASTAGASTSPDLAEAIQTLHNSMQNLLTAQQDLMQAIQRIETLAGIKKE